MNPVAYVGKVVTIEPIPGADRIVRADVVCGKGGKWSGVIGKDAHQVGDVVAVYLQDAIVPQTPEFAFMERHGWRVKMARFKGVPSECVIVPGSGTVGDSIPCEKYEKPLPASIGGEIAGVFPSFIPKTDEPNFQAVPHLVEAMGQTEWYATVKADGTSGTAYKNDGHFGVCSRNYELRDTESNVHWQVVKKYGLDKCCPEGIAFQFEIVGPGIQGNPMGLAGVEMRLFNVYSIADRQYLGYPFVKGYGSEWGLPLAELEAMGTSLPADLRKSAEGKYPNGKPREGLVYRALYEQRVAGERLSFKVINLEYRG